jgi:predicted nucleic acid-binding protein
MILVDSSVWVDYFNGFETRQSSRLDALLGSEPVAIGDLIQLEVLQGFRNERDFKIASSLFAHLTTFDLLGQRLVMRAAQNYRSLRARGITIRKTSDTIIATFCIANEIPLLYSDRDFNPFAEYLGLQMA